MLWLRVLLKTDMTRALSDDQRAGILAQVPAGRLGGAQEIASAVAFLASDEASYITGETLHVNGGMYMVLITIEKYLRY
ncbi:3-oxoacyl-ACP reductase [Salmonella enterica subsp. enterica]|nr:3-oxoacyl-ACP reductase [Salmonella enterica subsp. enterica]